MAKTLQQLAQEALDVQDACNLSGVAQSFARVMLDLRELARTMPPEANTGTEWSNTHPIAVLWADKIASLTNTQFANYDVVSKAYDAVFAWAKGTAMPATIQHTAETCPGRPCSDGCDHVEFKQVEVK